MQSELNSTIETIMLKKVTIIIILGSVAPYFWTWITNIFYGRLFVNYLDNVYIFWMIGIMAAIISTAILFVPAGYYLKGKCFLNWVYFILVFAIINNVGMYLLNATENISIFWSSINTWVYILLNYVFICVGAKAANKKERNRARE